MKKVAFVCILFLILSCSKKDSKIDLTSKTEAFYIENDATTSYLGQKTVKVTVFDTMLNSVCTSSFVQFEDLTQTGIKILFNKNGTTFPSSSIYPSGGGGQVNAQFSLCNILPCNSSVCPTASDVIPLMKASYDSVHIASYTELTKYIEKDSTTAFLGQETLRLTRIDTTTTAFIYTVGSSPRTYCLSNLLEIENLTDKTVEVTIYNPLAPTPTVWKKTVILPRQKAGEKFNLQGTFTCLYCCASNAQVIAKIKATYN